MPTLTAISSLFLISILGCSSQDDVLPKQFSPEESYVLIADSYQYDDTQSPSVLVLKNCIRIGKPVEARLVEGKYVIQCDDLKLKSFLITSQLPVHPETAAIGPTLLPFETVDFFQQNEKPVVEIYKVKAAQIALDRSLKPDSIFLYLPKQQ